VPKLAASLALLTLPLNLAAAAQQPNPKGVWDGTIGQLSVRACFDERAGDPVGVYFYRSRFETIPLIKYDKAPLLFSEGWPDDAKAPRWSLTQVGPNAIAGSWTQGQRKLPIRLTRIPVAQADEDGGPCSSMELQQPRLEGLRIVRTGAVKDGVSYTKLTLDHRGHFGDSVAVESFELAGDSPAMKAIDAVLKKPFDEKDESSWLSCIREAFPWGGEHNESFEPRMISRRWLVLNHHWDGYCGGAHPDSSNTTITFDLATGRQIDVRDWFNDRAVKRTRYEGDREVFKTMQPEFRTLVVGRWKGSDDCEGTIDNEEWWNFELTRTGYLFRPVLAHVVQACEEDFTMPFSKLAPYLTPEGRKAVAELQSEGLSRR
jgi:hypothetical protein